MFNKTRTRILCLFIVTVMVTLFGSVSFAEPAETPVNIYAQYTYDEGEGTYTLDFSSTTNLPEIKDIAFEVNVSDGTVKSADFAPALVGDNTSVTKTNLKATFTKGAESSSVSGKIALFTIVIIEASAEPSTSSITLSNITAKGADDAEIVLVPTLTISHEPVLPVLSEKEQDAYDTVTSLISADALSFYTDETDTVLADISNVIKSIEETAEAYNSLTAEEKSNVDETLAFNNKTAEGLGTLITLVEDMEKASEVLSISSILGAVDDADILKYKFWMSTYDAVITEFGDSEPTFTGSVALKSEYDAAKAVVSAKKDLIGVKYGEIPTDSNGYESKIDLLDEQLSIIQSLASSPYYTDFIDDLIAQSDALKGELDEYQDGITKDALLSAIDIFDQKIDFIVNSASSLPSVKVGDVRLGYRYTITYTRDADAAIDASIEISIYEEEDLETPIDTKTIEFAEGKKTVEASIMALHSSYPSNENIIIRSNYIFEGAEFELAEKTAKCRRPSSADELSDKISGGSSISKPGSNSSNKNENSIFPDPDEYEEDEDNNKDNKSDRDIFNDIKKYDWAKEAIENLYYAGIVNGMEEGVFNPSGAVTREQFCKMVVQLFGVLENETSTPFVDVSENAWYAPYIYSTISAGYVQGQSDEYFGIGESIMRQDMATIIYRALGSKNSSAVLDFTDTDDIAPYAEYAVSELVGLGVINGYEDGSFKPRGTATRAEAAKIIWEVYKILND